MLKSYLFFTLPLFFIFTITLADPLIVEGQKHRDIFVSKPDIEVLKNSSVIESPLNSNPKYFMQRGIGEVSSYSLVPKHSFHIDILSMDLTGFSFLSPYIPYANYSLLATPQNFLYGGQALAGAILINNDFKEQPTKLQQSHFQIENDNFYKFEHYYKETINKKNQVAISYSFLNDDKYFYNNYLNKKTNKENSFSELFSYQYNEKFKLQINQFFSYIDSGYDQWSQKNKLITKSDQPGKDNETVFSTSLILEWPIDSQWKLKINNSLTVGESLYSYDEDWANNDYWNKIENWYTDYDYFSQTTHSKAKRHHYLNIQKTTNSSLQMFQLHHYHIHNITQQDQFKNKSIKESLKANYNSDNYSLGYLFSMNWKKSKKLNVAISKEWQNLSVNYDNRILYQSEFKPIAAELSFENLGLNHITKISFFKGYSLGLFNTEPSLLNSYRKLKPEEVYGSEWHFKKYIGQNSNFSIKAFYYLRLNQQLKTSEQFDKLDPSTFVTFRKNQKENDIYGLEWFANSQLSNKWNLKTSINFLINESLINNKNRQQAYSPYARSNLSLQYSFTAHWLIALNHFFQDQTYFSNTHNKKNKSLSLFSFLTEYHSKTWSAEIFVKNLLNETYSKHGFYFSNEPPDWKNKLYLLRGEPLSFGLSFVKKW